ncbi:hypothetical protein EV138_6925 [Kribbella voronezhensis]|uniref:Uncharacterized protein n=1 Tax=Kribbella voronezhensis TaxID=2512212 RepID=A0A4R7SYP2_9ACTN|nr:hypothetical protein [Kribbella voronezhensis]TDU84454.1 hypothetical protein EV138_6925 [Kribbella voronezhensis]
MVTDPGVLRAQGNNAAGPDEAVIAEILSRHRTVPERLRALEESGAPELVYGLRARTDEEAEITVVASYLQAKKRAWRAELASRDAGNPPVRDAWEAFQQEMDEVTPGVERNQPVWFLQSNGYAVTGTNRDELNALGAARERPARDDPQQQLGITYQRDTMYAMLPDGAISRHVGSFDAATSAAEIGAWGNGVVRVQSRADELRLRIAGVVDDGAGNVTLRGTVLEGPVSNRGFAVGSALDLHKDRSTGALTIRAPGSRRDHLAGGAWAARLETFAYHQGLTRVNEGVGMHLPGAGAPEKRNRGPSLPVDDALFEQIRERYTNPEAPERGYGQTLGPTRTRLNFGEAGWDVDVQPYRRLGGDAMFTEAEHPAPAPYDGTLPPPSSVDVSDTNWYYNLTNAMPGRFVGGRSSSAALYLSAATMLLHEDRLSLDDCSDLMAFTIADMVVSGEHSLPECMTSVVMAAGSSQPWQDTPLNLAQNTPPLTAWLHLVSPTIRDEMRTDARATLQQLLANPTPDPKLVKGLTLLLKTTGDFEQSQSAQSIELTHAMRAGLNPTPASAQGVLARTAPAPSGTAGVAEQQFRHRPADVTQGPLRDL